MTSSDEFVNPAPRPDGEPPAPSPSFAAKAAVVLAVIALLVTAERLGILADFAEPAKIQRTLLDLGPYGYLAFVLAYATLQPFGVPGTVFIFAAPLIWPWPIAFALSMTGTMAASVVGFSFARFVARDFVSKRIPVRFRRYEAALETRGFATVVLLRFVFWMPPLLHAFFGVSKVRFGTHFWGSLVGYIVPLLLVSYFGERMFEAARRAPASVWVGTGAAVVVAVVGYLVVRRRRAAQRNEAMRATQPPG